MSVGFWTFESWKSEYSCVRGEKWCLVLLFEINVVVLHPVNLYAYVRAKINVVNCKELAVKTSFFCVKFHQNDGSTACCADRMSASFCFKNAQFGNSKGGVYPFQI